MNQKRNKAYQQKHYYGKIVDQNAYGKYIGRNFKPWMRPGCNHGSPYLNKKNKR